MTNANDSTGFTAEERAAIKEHAREIRAVRRGSKQPELDGEAAVLAKIAEMSDVDRAIAERIHAIVAQVAPDLAPRTWYGMPAYAKGTTVICFFQPGTKFKTRYSTLGFSDAAGLDDGRMWPNAYAITELTADEESRIADLVRRAAN